MAKKVFIWIGSVLMAGYVLFAMMLYGRQQKELRVQKVYIQVKDSVDYPYVTSKEISRLLKENQLEVIDKKLKEVDLSHMERVIEKHSMVKNAECSLSPAGHLCVKIEQRIPVLRIYVAGGNTFFLDQEGKRMTINRRVAVDVPVALVQRTDSLNMANLFELACLISKDDFWDAMIAQIVLDSSGKYSLIPRLGELEIKMGKAENMEFKLRALRSFYEEALPKLGWDRYRSINLEFGNQIVCTKK
ncbi:MAG: hypothetical protein PHF61_00620 [Bacteroidales bacterium]|jgi:cell division protein FtsQ|nr:hypothetical protein [Bacteroidales bacterium]MDD4429900.1 hypothetical protein [Bacteroidales bacterium]